MSDSEVSSRENGRRLVSGGRSGGAGHESGPGAWDLGENQKHRHPLGVLRQRVRVTAVNRKPLAREGTGPRTHVPQRLPLEAGNARRTREGHGGERHGTGQRGKAVSWMRETCPGRQLLEALSAPGRSRKTHLVWSRESASVPPILSPKQGANHARASCQDSLHRRREVQIFTGGRTQAQDPQPPPQPLHNGRVWGPRPPPTMPRCFSRSLPDSLTCSCLSQLCRALSS